MIDRTTRLRFRRRIRRSQKQLEGIGVVTDDNLERHFFRRLGRLYGVRRFILTWVLLVILLIGGVVAQARGLSSYYQTVKALPGGIYTEGIIGSFSNANPIYATTDVDASVSRLIFGGLFKFDQDNNLVSDLATKWQVDDTGKIYTVFLRSGVKWHDGVEFTAADVVFTYKTIQNPDAKSPLFSSWAGITVAPAGEFAVTFKLPNVLAAFPFSLTNGLIPRHLLQTVPISSLRSAQFNTAQPVGTGPFHWETIEVTGNTINDREQRIGLLPNASYYNGHAQVNRFIIRTYLDEERMVASFRRNELTAIAGSDSLPIDLTGSPSVNIYNVPLTSAVMVFLRTTSEILKDTKVRQALVKGTDTAAIVHGLTYPTLPVNEPLLHNQIGYDPALTELPYDFAGANALLDQAGWVKNATGLREKAGLPLRLSIFALSNPEFANVMTTLQKQWQDLGVQLDSNQLNDLDLQGVLKGPSYDTLLYGISIGNDPDVFPYWHSQANTLLQKRINFSDYSSKQADNALEAGRTRLDPALRILKYRPFLEAWRNDAPAIALYQSRFLYVTRGTIYNFNPRIMNAAVDRFSNVQNWMVRSGKQTN